MAEKEANNLDSILKLIQVLSVVVGAVISILSFNNARVKEAEARKSDFEKRQIEAAKPLLELRQKRYMETIEAVSVLATPDKHTPQELDKARKRFEELYWGELSMVEEKGVEAAMVRVRQSLDSGSASEIQKSTYNLSHILRDSLLKSWGVEQEKAGEITPSSR